MHFKDIVLKKMFANDAFSKWLGIAVEDVTPGSCIISMKVRSEMTNGFGIAHGGITYSLADSALAFASNSRGKHALSIETSISHTKMVKVDDVIKAQALEVSRSGKFAIYHVSVINQNNDVVALFKGTVYIKDIAWQDNDSASS